MAIYMNHQRRRRDWIDGCTARTGLLICALSAVVVFALVAWGLFL